MNEMVQIRSVKQFFHDFIVAPLQKDGNNDAAWLSRNRELLRKQLIDAFRKEVFDQIVFKLGPDAAGLSRDELAQHDGTQNILEQSFRKWRRLCILCSEYGVPIIHLEDLKNALTEEDAEDAHLTEPEGENASETV